MYFILYLYIAFVVYWGIKISRSNAFYIYSPFIIIYLQFAVMDVVPLLMNINDAYIPNNLKFVTTTTAIINMVLMTIFYKDMTTTNHIEIPDELIQYNSTRKKMYYSFWGVMLMLGIATGTTLGLLSGADVENSRRTSEVGIGFVRDIPYLGLPFLLLTILFIDKHLTFIKAGFKSLVYGILHFLSTAGRAGILQGFEIFLAWFGLKRRTIKFWEYCAIFYLLSPIVASLLFIFRSGVFEGGFSFELFSHQNMIFNSNTLKMMYFIGESNFLYGYGYYYSLVKLIPRFIWPEKPLAIDYYYKDMLDLDFDGGGIYTTVPNDFFINFGYFYIIPYILWLLLIHLMYKQLIKKQDFLIQIFCLIFLLFYHTPNNAIAGIQIFLLFIIVCRLVYNKFRVI